MTKNIEEQEIQNPDLENDGAELTENTEEHAQEVDPIAELEEKIIELETSVKDEKDNALRSLAELENFRRRNQQEVDTFKKYASEKVVLEFLPILDSFSLACHHAQAEAGDEKSVIDGFVLVQKQFEQALEKLNVKQIDALDTPFDPTFHQAISQEKVDGKESGIVIKEMQKGYQLHDRVIRPSLVAVSE